jgi:hypothetical protein
LWTAYQAMQLLLPLRWRRSEAAGKRAASLTYLPEGRLSEGTGHGSHRVTGGMGLQPVLAAGEARIGL